MSEQFTHTAVVRDIKEGRFDDQYDITFTDGSEAQVYEKKRDGSPTKVWPLILKSKTEGLPYTWQGNLAKGQYRTITWGKPAPAQPSTWGGPTNAEGAAPTTPTAIQNQAAANVARLPNEASVTHEIEAAWAINTILATNRDPMPKSPEEIAVLATNLVILKRRVANKLAQQEDDAA